MTESDVGNTASQREGDDDQPADDENVFVGKLEGHNFKNMIRILKSVVIRKVNFKIGKKLIDLKAVMDLCLQLLID